MHGPGIIFINKEENGMDIWIESTPAEEKDLRQWARDNWSVEDGINLLWHPVIREECLKILEESRTDEP